MIIGIGHQKHTGKDTFVKFCIDYLRQTPEFSGSKKIVRRGFADKLYDTCYHLYSWAGFQSRQYYVNNYAAKDQVLPELGKTPRDILIKLSNKMREYDGDIWLNANIRDSSFDLLFVTDVRYPNEFEALERQKAILLCVTRPGLPAPTDEADTALNHYMDRWHHSFDNNECLNKLLKDAQGFCNTYILGRK